jgi:hypothetical protein
MKRFIMIMLVFIPFGVAAQNRQIETIAAKYADKEGFSTTVVKGKISSGFAGSLNIESVDISNLIKNISSIIVIRAEKPVAEFATEVENALTEGYSTVLSSSANGERVRFLLSESDDEHESEFVIVILGKETNLVVSIVGNYTLGKVTKPNN